MHLDDIEKYLEFLQAQLGFFGVKHKESGKVIESIRERMHSLILHWNDEAFRKGVLITGLEEAVFYEPKIKDDDTRAFVVLTIRNSLYENLENNDKYTKKVTGAAIRFFNKLDFGQLCGKLDKKDTADFYGVAEKYPIAWRALKELSADFTGQKWYNPVSAPRYEIRDKQRVNASNNVTEVGSGIDPEISGKLFSALCAIEEDRIDTFHVDCFKMVSRHFEKLLQVLEFVLSRNKPFLSANYRITNGYLVKRGHLLRPGHRLDEADRKQGLYADALNSLVSGYLVPWRQKGFDDATLLAVAESCTKKGLCTLADMNAVIARFYKHGITTAAAIDAYIAENSPGAKR
ncbi:MAG: hypothetical protein LBQ69_03575 [Treponema sp.]|nr:hypothetical protein [Treponema sp.]